MVRHAFQSPFVPVRQVNSLLLRSCIRATYLEPVEESLGEVLVGGFYETCKGDHEETVR